MQEQLTKADRAALRSIAPLAAWTLAWVATLAVAKFGPLLWEREPVLSWSAWIVNVAVGIAWIVAHARYLRGVDDLQRKIMLDAMGVALGAAIVGGCAYAVAGSSGLFGTGAGVGVLAILVAAVYIGGVAVGSLRYR